jgi:hypothetical protein
LAEPRSGLSVCDQLRCQEGHCQEPAGAPFQNVNEDKVLYCEIAKCRHQSLRAGIACPGIGSSSQCRVLRTADKKGVSLSWIPNAPRRKALHPKMQPRRQNRRREQNKGRRKDGGERAAPCLTRWCQSGTDFSKIRQNPRPGLGYFDGPKRSKVGDFRESNSFCCGSDIRCLCVALAQTDASKPKGTLAHMGLRVRPPHTIQVHYRRLIQERVGSSLNLMVRRRALKQHPSVQPLVKLMAARPALAFRTSARRIGKSLGATKRA